ncbi:hypothetical protein BBP40_003238 [Aspergillus hancockii]|nr:hypothetical protein BBP40_003238 [Aspergillus hancockii]
MTEPARKVLKSTEGSQGDTTFSSQIGRTRYRSVVYDSETDSQISEAELPHKHHDAATPAIGSENGIGPGSDRESSSSLSDIPIMEDPGLDDLSVDEQIKYEDSENDTKRSIDLHTSSSECDQRDSPYIHSQGDTTEKESSPESKMSTNQVRGGTVARHRVQTYTRDELEQIGAVLYREADAALRGLMHKPTEDAHPAAGQESTASTSPRGHGGQDNIRDPDGGHSESAGNEQEPVHPIIRASAEFQNQVNHMMAEFYHQREDKVDDFGLAVLRRKPLGEWYT